MEMPGGTEYGVPATNTWFGGNLTDYVRTGRISQARLTVSKGLQFSVLFWDTDLLSLFRIWPPALLLGGT